MKAWTLICAMVCGIRHRLLGESNLDVEDARFMLVACSGFINYLVVKADKAGLKLNLENSGQRL